MLALSRPILGGNWPARFSFRWPIEQIRPTTPSHLFRMVLSFLLPASKYMSAAGTFSDPGVADPGYPGIVVLLPFLDRNTNGGLTRAQYRWQHLPGDHFTLLGISIRSPCAKLDPSVARGRCSRKITVWRTPWAYTWLKVGPDLSYGGIDGLIVSGIFAISDPASVRLAQSCPKFPSPTGEMNDLASYLLEPEAPTALRSLTGGQT